jgi:lipoprotein signal peptidase
MICITGLLGLWLIMAGFIIKAANGNLYDNFTGGLIVAFLDEPFIYEFRYKK